jgi:hypothetical protein
MQVSAAIMLLDSGSLTEATLSKHHDPDGWIVHFGTLKPVNFSLELETQKSGLRVFKSLDSAVATLEKIGFKKVAIVLS